MTLYCLRPLLPHPDKPPQLIDISPILEEPLRRAASLHGLELVPPVIHTLTSTDDLSACALLDHPTLIDQVRHRLDSNRLMDRLGQAVDQLKTIAAGHTTHPA